MSKDIKKYKANTKELKELIKKDKLSLSQDSRTIEKGQYFVAIKRDRFDGHDFIETAMDKGAKGYIEEDDLYELTKYKLELIDPKIVGITGSSGKTTVTYFVFEMLSLKFKTAIGSLNTKLGLALEFMKNARPDTEIFVAEMGMDYMGELDDITQLFPPDVAVITTINTTHIEKLESIVNITKAKAQILDHLKKGAYVLLNSDNRYTKRIGKQFKGKVDWFGAKDLKKYKLKDLDLPGEHNKVNMLIAIKIAKYFGVEDDLIYNNLDMFKLQKGRLNFLEGINGSIIIDDTYNANPDSTKNAIDVLMNKEGERKIAILGDMLELGKLSNFYHKNLGEYIDKTKPDILICSGDLAKDIVTGVYNKRTKLMVIENSEKFKDIINDLEITEGDVILVKGSQGARMEKVVYQLLKVKSKAPDLLVRQDIRWTG